MACSATKPGDRGREARRPREFPRAGWRDILLRTKDGITRDHVSIVAAGVAFYTMLALFPALAAAISIWGLLADPQEIQQQIAALGGMLPPDVVDIVRQQGEKVAAGAGGVTLAAAGGLLLALWSASRGTNSLIEGLNICYGETEKRGLVKVNLVALGLTLAGTVGFVVALGLVAVLPALLGNLGLGATAAALVEWLRWPLLFVLMMAALAVVYRYAPSLGYAHDLVVVERLDREEGPAAAELNAALFDTGRPVLIAPPARPAAMPDCCVIAWNGAVQAARAIASALPFLQAAGRVQILVGRGTAGFDTGPLRDYLAAHGVTAEPVAYDSERLTARARGRALLAAAAAAGGDLLVAGAYGEGSSVDDVAGLGRATRKVVTAARFPVLLQA